MTTAPTRSVVLLSGGLDSAVALALTIQRGPVEALTFDYGQRHRREVQAAREIAAHYEVPHTVVAIDAVLFGGSALTFGAKVPDGAAAEPDATYVPARNTVFLALAAARAEAIGARWVVFGANRDDAGGYPDCRPGYIMAFRDVLNQGTLNHVWVNAPLLYVTKAAVIVMARELNVPIGLTWSCYRGEPAPCGTCGACELRAEVL